MKKLVYYGLTEKESKQKKLKYEYNQKFDAKGVNVSLDGLIKFILDNKLVNIIKYYTIIPLDQFQVIDNIEYDSKYDMIAIQIPFKFNITNTHKISLNKKS